MKKQKEEMPSEQNQIRIRHSTTNIRRTIALMNRAVRTLTFANGSLEGTEAVSMMEDIGNAKRSLADAIRSLSKYSVNEEGE